MGLIINLRKNRLDYPKKKPYSKAKQNEDAPPGDNLD
jgi:hypothetical protein